MREIRSSQRVPCVTLECLDSLPESLPDVRERVRRHRGDAESLHTLGVMLAERGEFRRSFVCHCAAAAGNREEAKYLFHSGSAALTLGRADDAAGYLDKALGIDPGHADAWQTRGQLYADLLDRPDEALRCYVRAIELGPDENLVIHQSAARCVLSGHGQSAAAARLREAMPRGVDPLNADRGLALALAETGCYDDAVPIFLGILRQRPGDQVSMRGLADMCTGQRDWRGAQSWYEQAMAAGDDTLTVISYLVHLSRLGDFDHARQLYHSHDLGKPIGSPVGSAVPRWQGQDLRGKKLRLIGGDRYFGDALQYVRFARQVKEAGAHVVLQAPKRLRSLLSTVAGVDSVVAPHDPTPPLDYEAVAFWMLWEMSAPVEDMICRGPYLQAPADLREQWSRRIAPTAGINVGIVWCGSPKLQLDRFRYRSMHVSELRLLAAIRGVTLYSLQCGAGRTELLDANPPFPAVDLAPDFPNTAAIIEALDLVVTVDTSIAHLAGGLGKRTFLMLPYNADFRWMADRDDTPWYPATRLFRQTRPGQWSDVVAGVARALEQ
jgi:tetratricopeptide (TPR) repeat protein